MPTIKKLSAPYPVKPQQKKPNQGRENPNRHIYGTQQWRKLSLHVRNKEPLCRMCKKHGIREPATKVDHIIPINHGGEPYDESNLQPLCLKCHQQKSASERHLKH